MKLAAAYMLTVQVQDPQRAIGQPTKDGRLADLRVGVWAPGGMYYPARALASPAVGAVGTGSLPGLNYGYQVPIPFDTAVKVFVGSRDLKLGDALGVANLTGEMQQEFQQSRGTDANSVTLTVLGFLTAAELASRATQAQ